MAIVKKRNEQTQKRLLLEDYQPVELPPAEIDDAAIVIQFDGFKPFIPELLDTLRAGTLAELVPVMMDGSTFAIHGATRTFWVKLWHTDAELTRIERAQVLSCLPSTRGVRVMTDDMLDAEEDEFDDDDYEDDQLVSDDEAATEHDASTAEERRRSDEER